MRSTFIALLLVLGASVPAQARTRTLVPPGNSAAGQYVEVIPTAGGGRPTDTVHPLPGQPGGGGGQAGRGGGVGSNGGSGSESRTAASAQRALTSQGPDGVAAAALARATAPSVSQTGSGHAPVPARTGRSASAPLSGRGSSPVVSLAKSLTGSSSAGGLGPLLPIILVASALGAAGLALLRRRTT